jgi:TolA-binding protein
MARDVAGLTQQIDELKATVAQLKAAQEHQAEQRQGQHQEQVSQGKPRPDARLSEAKPVEPRPTKLGAPPRPLGTIVQRTRPIYPAPQAGYAPAPLPPPGAAPAQIAPPPPSASSPDDEVVRPPMPVR